MQLYFHCKKEESKLMDYKLYIVNLVQFPANFLDFWATHFELNFLVFSLKSLLWYCKYLSYSDATRDVNGYTGPLETTIHWLLLICLPMYAVNAIDSQFI